jgi:small subunit ribosomal protein S6
VIQNQYEIMVIVHPQADEEAVTAFNEQVGQWASAQGGELVNTNVWGRRKLAYAIEKQTEGTYVVYDLRMPSAGVAELDRNLRLHEQVVRFLVVRQGD